MQHVASLVQSVRKRLQILAPRFRADEPIPIQEYQVAYSDRIQAMLWEGGVVCIIGPPGSGKSHILEHAIQQLTITLEGRKIHRITLPSTFTQDPAKLVNAAVEQLNALLGANEEIISEIPEDEKERIRARYHAKLAQDMHGAIPLRAEDTLAGSSAARASLSFLDSRSDSVVVSATHPQQEHRLVGVAAASQYASSLDEIKRLLQQILLSDDLKHSSTSRHIIFEMDHFDLLAHQTKRQTFLYSFLELLAVSPSNISIVASTCRSDVFTLLEKRVASRFPQRQVIIEPISTIEHLLPFYRYWLLADGGSESLSFPQESWVKSVEELLSGAECIESLEQMLLSTSNLRQFQNHITLLLSTVVGRSRFGAQTTSDFVPQIGIEDFRAPIEKFLFNDTKVAVALDLPRLEIILLAAIRNLESNVNLNLAQFYSFEDIYAEYQSILEIAKSGLHRNLLTIWERYQQPKLQVLRAFENLLDLRLIEFHSDKRGPNIAQSILLSTQFRPVRTTLTLAQLELIVRSRRNEMDVLKSSNKF